MKKNNICYFCLKEFRDNHDYVRHLNNKNKCINTGDSANNLNTSIIHN